MAQQVEILVAETSLFRAKRQLEDVRVRLGELETRFSEVWTPAFASVLGDLRERAKSSVEKLELQDLQAKLEGPWQEFLDASPSGWHEPVEHAAYLALWRCRVFDPGSRVRKWGELERGLDAHQARHFFEEAKRRIASPELPAWDDVAPMLARAVVLDAELAPAIAPLACLLLRPPLGARGGHNGPNPAGVAEGHREPR